MVARNEGSNQSSDKGKSVVLTPDIVFLFQELLCLGGKKNVPGIFSASASLGISFYVNRNSALHSVSSIASKSNLS